jgi:hypothetical protein
VGVLVISLNEAKIYLRVDGDEEDTLITSCIAAAEDICEDVLRFSLKTFEVVPEPVKQAVLFATAQFYEMRERLEAEPLIDIVKRLLFAYRLESW